jgi:hypothetical protein
MQRDSGVGLYGRKKGSDWKGVNVLLSADCFCDSGWEEVLENKAQFSEQPGSICVYQNRKAREKCSVFEWHLSADVWGQFKGRLMLAIELGNV